MKKNRPALKVTCICALADVDRIAELVFRETTTIGVRYSVAQRKTLCGNSTRSGRITGMSR